MSTTMVFPNIDTINRYTGLYAHTLPIMRCRLESPILLIHKDDIPPYKKQGSVVRNSYFWALKSISDHAPFNQPWEFDQSVWVALCRMLGSFAMSGYLGDRETILEFPPNSQIPAPLKSASTWAVETLDW